MRETLDRVGDLLNLLQRERLYDGALIVVTSDNGEELFDHGGFGHGAVRIVQERPQGGDLSQAADLPEGLARAPPEPRFGPRQDALDLQGEPRSMLMAKPVMAQRALSLPKKNAPSSAIRKEIHGAGLFPSFFFPVSSRIAVR